MRGLKTLSIIGLLLALTSWSIIPAQPIETQPVQQPIQRINISCKDQYIIVEPISFQLSQLAHEKAIWHFVGSGPNSVGACKVGDKFLKENLKNIEINLNIPAWARSKYPDLLTLTYPPAEWQDGIDYEVEGEIGEKPLEENEIHIQYSIRFLSSDGKLLLERKGFGIKLVPAIECGVHPGPAKNKDGDYESITKALEDSARQCERIIVEPGNYKENPTIEPRQRPLKIEASGEERKPIIEAQLGREINQVLFLKQASNVTIEGLHIKGGNIGILVQRSHKVTIRNVKVFDNDEAGIRVTQSGEHGAILLEGVEAYNNGKSQNNREHKGGIVITNSSQNVTIANSLVHDNPADGIVITRGSRNVTISNNEIRNNEGNGIFIKDSAVDLISNTIVKNGEKTTPKQPQPGCGVKVEGYPSPTDSLSRSNSIIANGPEPANGYPDRMNNYNTCPKELAQVIKQRRIDIPYLLEGGKVVLTKIQDAIYEAEPVQGKDDRPYQLVISSGHYYTENLCIDRSIFIRATYPVTLRPKKKENPTIALASGDCPLIEDNPGKPIQITIQGPLEGSIIVDGAKEAKVGLQVGTLHSQRSEVSLEVTLVNVTIQNYTEIGVKVGAEDEKNHSLRMQLLGGIPLEDASCTLTRDPTPPSSSPTWIRNNGAGIMVDVPQAALVQLQLENTLISNNSDAGLQFISKRAADSGQPDLQISRSWIFDNSGTGFSVESQQAAKPMIEMRDVRLWKNQKGGVLLKATEKSLFKANLTNVDIRENRGFGVEIAGAVHATLKADVPNPESDRPVFIHHNCWISKNMGPGVSTYGPTSGETARVTIEKLFIFKNGFDEMDKPFEREKAHGIFVSGLVDLTIKYNLIGLYTTAPGIMATSAGNAGVGILLLDPTKKLSAEIIKNEIRDNLKWGVAYVSQGCLKDMPTDVTGVGKIKGSKNKIVDNGARLEVDEAKWGHEKQVCPIELKSLMEE